MPYQQNKIEILSAHINLITMFDEIRYAYLKGHPLFSHLPESTLRDISAYAKVKMVCRGEIFGFGENSYSKIYFLIKGKIKVTESDELNNELIKEIIMDGDIFGDLPLEGSHSLYEYAEALTPNTILCYFNVADFKRI